MFRLFCQGAQGGAGLGQVPGDVSAEPPRPGGLFNIWQVQFFLTPSKTLDGALPIVRSLGGRGFGFSCQACIPIRLPLEDTHERDLRDEIRRVLRDLLFYQEDGLMQFLEPFFAAARLDEYETPQGAKFTLVTHEPGVVGSALQEQLVPAQGRLQ